MTQPLQVFCCYARKDQQLLNDLKAQLMPLQHRGLITIWADTDINAGLEWEQEIDKHLNTAQIILLLISADFMASDYCYSKEMKRALERHEQGKARVIPVILRPVSWQDGPLGNLQALPRDAKPVRDRSWNKDAAFADVVDGIRRTVVPLLTNQSLVTGKAEYDQHRYKDALSTYEGILEFDPNCGDAYLGKGMAMEALKEKFEALAAYNHAIRLKADEAICYERKGQVLLDLCDYEKALEAVKQAIELASESKQLQLQIQRGDILRHLHRYEDALKAYNTAIDLDTKVDPQVYHYKGVILEHLALQAHRIAQQHGYVTKDQDALQELSALFEKLSNGMIGKLEIPMLVKNILEKVTQALRAEASSLYVIDPETRALRIQAEGGYQHTLVSHKAQYNLDEDGITPYIARTRREVIARSRKELHQHIMHVGTYDFVQQGYELNAFLGIPLKALDATGTGQVIGVLEIEYIRSSLHHKQHLTDQDITLAELNKQYLTDQDITLVELMGSVITTLIQSTYLNEIRLHELNEGLGKISGAMVGELDMNVLVKRIVTTISKVLRAEASSLYLIEPGTDILSIQAATGYQEVLVDRKAQYDLKGKGITPYIARTGKEVIARSKEELQAHEAHAGKYNIAQGREPNSFLGIPLKIIKTGGSEERIGVLKIEDVHSDLLDHPEKYFTEQDIILAEMMGSVLTTAILIMWLAMGKTVP